jgi:hypothetical protein
MKKLFAIQNKKYGAVYNPYENRFFESQWATVWCNDREYLEVKMDENPVFFSNCQIIEEEFDNEQLIYIDQF